METTNQDRAKAAAKLARLLIVLGREIGDADNVNEDRTWLREHTLPPDEIEYGGKHAIDNLRDISQLISDADDCTATLGNHPLSKRAKAVLFLAREAIGEADVPAQWAMDDGKDEEAVRIVRDALRRVAGRCHDKMELLAADVAAEFAEFKRGPANATEKDDQDWMLVSEAVAQLPFVGSLKALYRFAEEHPDKLRIRKHPEHAQRRQAHRADVQRLAQEQEEREFEAMDRPGADNLPAVSEQGIESLAARVAAARARKAGK